MMITLLTRAINGMGCNFGRRTEREREESDLIGSLSLEQPKVGYPNPPDK